MFESSSRVHALKSIFSPSFYFLAAEEGEEESVSTTQIRGEALEKLRALKDNLGLEDDFDDLDFGDSSEEDEQ